MSWNVGSWMVVGCMKFLKLRVREREREGRDSGGVGREIARDIHACMKFLNLRDKEQGRRKSVTNTHPHKGTQTQTCTCEYTCTHTGREIIHAQEGALLISFTSWNEP